MTIGLDLSVIQTPHRMRGIGATAIKFVNNLSSKVRAKHTYVIYLYADNQESALEILDLEGMNYEIRTLNPERKFNLKLPGRLRILNGILSNSYKILEIYKGDSRISDTSGLDSFIQFDQMRPVPRKKGLKTALILYDIIPYVMVSDYLWSYKTARHYQDSRKSAIRKDLHRRLYAYKTKATAKRADKLIAISQHTKDDFVKYLGFNRSRITVVHLGIDTRKAPKASEKAPAFKHYLENSWGYFPEPITLSDKPFLLFVGGADPRRRLNDLVAAFNNLRAQGVDMRLVLVGDTMKGPHAIPTKNIREYLLSSSYLEDIVFLGFVTDEQKDWLYENTLAFVFPSVYEGFGLPVLEALHYGTDVITYKNSSIQEVASDLPHYAKDASDIEDIVHQIITNPASKTSKQLAIEHASHYTWQKASTSIIKVVS